MSPGKSWAAANAITLRRKSVISARPSRRSRNRAIRAFVDPSGRATPRRRTVCAAARRATPLPASGQRRVAQVDLTERVGLVPLHLLGAGCEVVVEVREDHRRIVQEQRLDLLRV